MANNSSFTALQTPFLDAQGKVSWTWLKLLQQWQTQLGNGFDQNGNLISNISTSVQISGRDGTIGAILQNITSQGIFLAKGLPAATSTTQGAVILPAGAGSNKLGSAAMAETTSFDPVGSAAHAQAAASDHADIASTAAQNNAQAFASNASNITSGTLDNARLAGFSGVVTTAKLTTLGANGSMSFTNGLLISVVAAT